MSLKIAALGNLALLGALRAPTQADGQMLARGRVETYDPIATAALRPHSAVESAKRASRSIKQEAIDATGSGSPQKIS